MRGALDIQVVTEGGDVTPRSESMSSSQEVNDLSPYCSQNLSDLQFSVQELQQNLKDALTTADRLHAQKELLQKRVQILEKCLKSSQLEHTLSQNSDLSQQFEEEEQLEEQPLPDCQSLDEAMQVIRQLQNQLKIANFSLRRSQTERIELVRAIADQSHKQTHQLFNDQQIFGNSGSSVLRLDSDGTEASDALCIAEEMSYKVVVLQAEKEELGDALAGLQIENVQIKTVNEQLEKQVKYLLQQTTNTETQNNGSKRRIFRRRLIKA
eukprot:TRINITY_DN7937_c0_g1_i3.p2 TRINITY_DN7937_c0_g1~~TRINITY_DN7937_c0_g1_i3.p2  ORF type:complete len:267 (+),score=43.91 TRINITY_DN7937_c0_g1_i3:84-884(+)